MNPGSTVHSFHQQLAWSGDLSDEPAWVDFYRAIWPDMISCVRLDGKSDLQLAGVDRVIYRANGLREFRIDEKKRKKDYGDIALEVWDQVPLGKFDGARVLPGQWKRGWAVDPKKVCDFVVYAILPSQRAYLLPFELLRLTMVRWLPTWKADGTKYPKAARNRDYWTINVAVPWSVLNTAMTDTMTMRFGGSELTLPEPVTTAMQTTFSWPGPPGRV